MDGKNLKCDTNVHEGGYILLTECNLLSVYYGCAPGAPIGRQYAMRKNMIGLPMGSVENFLERSSMQEPADMASS